MPSTHFDRRFRYVPNFVGCFPLFQRIFRSLVYVNVSQLTIFSCHSRFPLSGRFLHKTFSSCLIFRKVLLFQVLSMEKEFVYIESSLEKSRSISVPDNLQFLAECNQVAAANSFERIFFHFVFHSSHFDIVEIQQIIP